MTPVRRSRLRWRTSALARGVRQFVAGPPPPPPPPVVVPRPPSKGGGIIELVTAEPRRSGRADFRLNLIVPSVADASTYGGIQTAIDLFRSVSAGGIHRRIISVGPLDASAGTTFADFTVVDAGDDLDVPAQLVSLTRPLAAIPVTGTQPSTTDATAATNGTAPSPISSAAGPAPEAPHAVVSSPVGPISLPIGPRDVFIATFWPTALFVLEVRAWQAATFGVAPPFFAYLLQDYEPGFYARSVQSLLSGSTYEAPEFDDRGLQHLAPSARVPRGRPAVRHGILVRAEARTRPP